MKKVQRKTSQQKMSEKDAKALSSGSDSSTDQETLTSCNSTYRIEMTITMTSSADKKKTSGINPRRVLKDSEKKFLKDAATELESRINTLKPFDQMDFSPPSDGDEVVYLPVEGTFNKRFFTRLYLLRYHVVANEIISEFDMVQYQIPVKASNTELILLIYGEHLFNHINTPKEELQEPLGKSLCTNTDEIIKQNCPVVSIPFSVWDYRDKGDRRTAVLISNEFRQFGEQAWRINKWIDENFKLAADEYSKSAWNMVKWVKEYKLFSLVRFWYPDTVFQYSPSWLAGQSLDLYIPSLNTGIEYQGKQHYEAIDYFGGEEKLQENTIRDKNKSLLCEKNNVSIIEWSYTKKVTFSAVMELFEKNNRDASEILSRNVIYPSFGRRGESGRQAFCGLVGKSSCVRDC